MPQRNKPSIPHASLSTLRSFRASLLLLCGLWLATTPLAAQPGSLDLSFNPDDILLEGVPGANFTVTAIALQPGGKSLIGGFFTDYNGEQSNHIARLHADGTLDMGFDTGMGASGHVWIIALQPDGKILIGGGFTSYNGTPRNRIARLHADGSLDEEFDPGMGTNGSVLAINLQPDGKILIGGSFTSCNGIARNRIARLNANGSLDTGFNPGIGANDDVYGMALQPDGKILISGFFTSYNGTLRNRIARLNADGSLDTGFGLGSGANESVRAIALDPDGKILIGGDFTSYNGTSRNRVARLNADGSLDTSLNPVSGANNVVTAFVLQLDGKILIGGAFTNYNGTPRNGIARLNADGSLDNGFNPASGADGSAFILAQQLDGKILFGGDFTLPRKSIARLNADGSLDTGFNPGTGADHQVNIITLQPDGKILIGGAFTSYNGTLRSCIARLNADGTLDAGFNPGTGADNTIWDVVLQPNGKILVGGAFTIFNGVPRNRIARLNADGSLDTSFNPPSGADGSVWTMALQPDGKILIGGAFTGYDGTARKRIARLNANGTLDTGFNPGSGADNTIWDVVLQPDGKVLIGGYFTNYNGIMRNRIARLNTDGSLDFGFNPVSGADGPLYTIALQLDGKILIGGAFSNYYGSPRQCIARLNADASLDSGFNPGAGAFYGVADIASQPDGKILIGGNFTYYDNTSRKRIARLNANGSLDTDFDPGTGANNTVYSIAVQPDEKILVGGYFTSCNGAPRNRITRLNGGASTISGDVCETANNIQTLFGQAVNTAQVSVPYDNTSTNNTDDPSININTCFFTDPVQHSLWFTFTGDGAPYRIRTVQGASTNYIPFGDTQAALFTGICFSPVFESCNDDEDANNELYNISFEVNTVVGKKYRLLLDGYGGAEGQFCLEVTRLGNVDATEITDTPVRLTPNPTTGTIQLSNIRAEEVQVFDCTGRLVQRLAQPGNTVDLSAQVAGLYLLQIREKGEVYSARVVKE